jgi:glycosyltransferase involved in cell wall biosynthesis
MKPFFSIVIPAYNRARLLPATIRSVLSQTRQDFEIIVVDDASTDGTADVAAAVSERVQVVRLEQNRKQAAARNAGLARATGEYVAFLDSDDLWFPWTLETFAQAIDKHDQPAFVCSEGVGFRDGAALPAVERGALRTEHYEDYLHWHRRTTMGCLLPTGVVVRTQIAKDVGGFCEKLVYYEDDDIWLRLGTARGFVRIVAPACWAYRVHPQNLSKDLPRVLTGMWQFLSEERQGHYPGGNERRGDRQWVIATRARQLARRAVHTGRARDGWSLYLHTLGMNIRWRRWKYLFGFPVESVMRVGRKSAVADARTSA